jgi:hypothetical protein
VTWGECIAGILVMVGAILFTGVLLTLLGADGPLLTVTVVTNAVIAFMTFYSVDEILTSRRRTGTVDRGHG